MDEIAQFVIVGALLTGCIPVALVWFFTRRIRRFWLRAIPRVLTIALIFGWAIVPAPELHGALPLPVPFALFAIYEESRWAALPAVLASVAVTALVLWAIVVGAWFIVRRCMTSDLCQNHSN